MRNHLELKSEIYFGSLFNLRYTMKTELKPDSLKPEDFSNQNPIDSNTTERRIILLQFNYIAASLTFYNYIYLSTIQPVWAKLVLINILSGKLTNNLPLCHPAAILPHWGWRQGMGGCLSNCLWQNSWLLLFFIPISF